MVLMAGRRSNRRREIMNVRLNESEMRSLLRIKESGDFTDVSETVRFCIRFTKSMLAAIPTAVGESFVSSDRDGEK